MKSPQRRLPHLVDAISIEIELAKVAQLWDGGLRDGAEIVVGEVKLDKRVEERAGEGLVVEGGERVPVEDETEDGEVLEGVRRDSVDRRVHDHQRVDLKHKLREGPETPRKSPSPCADSKRR